MLISLIFRLCGRLMTLSGYICGVRYGQRMTVGVDLNQESVDNTLFLCHITLRL